MSSKIEALPLPQGQARSRPTGPVALLAALVIAAGVAGYFALRQGEPASRPTAAYESSGVVTGTGPGLAELAGMHAAYENSGVITGSGPALQDLADRFAAYRNSGLVRGTGPALAESRGVDVIGIHSPSLWPSVAGLERQFGGATIAPQGFPSVAALERALGGTISSPSFPSVAALERALGGTISSPSFPSVAALERAINSSSVPDNCSFVRRGPC